MIKFIVKKTIKNYDDVKDQNVREKYGVLGGILGIICNLFLFGVKLVIGLLIGAFSIISDAFNNLTDSFSSLVSIISAKLSNKKPDKDHPFGHGRIEYVSTLIVAFVILIVGVELLITSVKKFFNGGDPLASGTLLYVSIAILACSLLIKLWMWSYNKYLGNKINSSVLLASAADSISDVITSTAIIVATLVGGLLLKDKYFYLDAALGVIVSIIICINGLKIVFETIGDLLGKPATAEEITTIEEIVMSDPIVSGIHDLIIHDYGPGRKFASVHAEIPSDGDIVEIHEKIDYIEQICYSKTNIELTIHMDPIDNSSPEVVKAREIVSKALQKYPDISFHDLRITNGEHNINVIFDLVVPHKYQNKDIEAVIKDIKNDVKELEPIYSLVVKIDRPFIELEK